jgi:hypothetical protein
MPLKIKISDCAFLHKGGGTAEMAALQPDERPDDYPESARFGPLPVQHSYLRHVRNSEFDNVEVAGLAADARPSFWLGTSAALISYVKLPRGARSGYVLTCPISACIPSAALTTSLSMVQFLRACGSTTASPHKAAIPAICRRGRVGHTKGPHRSGRRASEFRSELQTSSRKKATGRPLIAIGPVPRVRRAGRDQGLTRHAIRIVGMT